VWVPTGGSGEDPGILKSYGWGVWGYGGVGVQSRRGWWGEVGGGILVGPYPPLTPPSPSDRGVGGVLEVRCLTTWDYGLQAGRWLATGSPGEGRGFRQSRQVKPFPATKLR